LGRSTPASAPKRTCEEYRRRSTTVSVSPNSRGRRPTMTGSGTALGMIRTTPGAGRLDLPCGAEDEPPHSSPESRRPNGNPLEIAGANPGSGGGGESGLDARGPDAHIPLPADTSRMPDRARRQSLVLERCGRRILVAGIFSRGVDNAVALILTQRLGEALVASPPDMGFRLTIPRGSIPGSPGRSLVVFRASQNWPAEDLVSASCSLTS
jgi:hypothetical protein